MTTPSSSTPSGPTRKLRHVHPIVMLAVGLLLGAMLVAIRQSPNAQVATGAAAAAGGDAGGGASASASGTGAGATSAGEAASSSPSGAESVGGASSASGGGGGTSASAAQVTSGACGAKSKGVQGVSDTAIRVGFGIPDLSMFAAIGGEKIDPGDMQAQVKSALAGLRKDKRLPVCGRDIEPFFRKYSVIDPSEARAACVGFTEEDKVFAVITPFGFSAPDCVTKEHKVVLIDSGNAVYDSNFVNDPLLFTVDPSIDVELRATAHWIVKDGIVNGKKTGVYYNKQGGGGPSPPGPVVEQSMINEMAKLGYPIDEKFATDLSPAAGMTGSDPNDKLAVQRFKQAGVKVVITLSGDLPSEADRQDYHPQWIRFSDAMIRDEGAPGPVDQKEGQLGLQFGHVNEEAAGMPLNAQDQVCFRYWVEAGHPAPQKGRRDWAEQSSIRSFCDYTDLLTRALTNAGANLTSASFVAGMETIRDLPMARFADQTFTRTKHWGATKNIVNRWFKQCGCWRPIAPWRPLYAPY